MDEEIKSYLESWTSAEIREKYSKVIRKYVRNILFQWLEWEWVELSESSWGECIKGTGFDIEWSWKCPSHKASDSLSEKYLDSRVIS